MFVAKTQLRNPINYLQKPVQKMTINDITDLAEKAAQLLNKDKSSIQRGTGIAENIIYSHDLSDMFALNGKLNRQTKKDIQSAMKDGRLPKKATILDFFNAVIKLTTELKEI